MRGVWPRMRTLVAVLVLFSAALASAPAAHACLNETTMAHDEAVALVARAQTLLEKGDYAGAASWASKAIAPLSRRVEIGEGEAFERAAVPRAKDQLALSKAQAIALAAVIRSNATITRRGRPVDGPEAGDARLANFQDAYEGVFSLRKRAPKLALAKEIEAELMVRSTNLRAEGKATLEKLAKDDALSSAEGWAALATVMEEDGDIDEARRLRGICAQRAAQPAQCAPVTTFGRPNTPRVEPKTAASTLTSKVRP